MSRVGLVLGAGGVVGQAYHSGVLTALENDCGWDAREADVIVGTSAGSITAALLRCDVRASHLAAWTVGARLATQGATLPSVVGTGMPEFEPFRPSQLFRSPPRPPGWDMIRGAVARPWHFRPLSAALTLLAPGRYDIVRQLAALMRIEARQWPARDLWLCAVRRHDGRRVVFGRSGGPTVPLHLGVAASCAVPGYHAPVVIDRDAYVDGGVHSPTNAAVLRGRGLDLVVVVSPMSGPVGTPLSPYGVARWHSARVVRREVAALRRAGTPVVVFRPGPEEQRLMGDNLMSGTRVTDVLQRSFFAAGAYAGRPEIRELLLRHRPGG